MRSAASFERPTRYTRGFTVYLTNALIIYSPMLLVALTKTATKPEGRVVVSFWLEDRILSNSTIVKVYD